MKTQERRITDHNGYLVLPNEFRDRGFSFELLKRKGDGAVYKRWTDTERPHYEIFQIQRYEERLIAGNLIPAKEAVPPDSSWGSLAWTSTSEKDALKRLDGLEALIKERAKEGPSNGN